MGPVSAREKAARDTSHGSVIAAEPQPFRAVPMMRPQMEATLHDQPMSGVLFGSRCCRPLPVMSLPLLCLLTDPCVPPAPALSSPAAWADKSRYGLGRETTTSADRLLRNCARASRVWRGVLARLYGRRGPDEHQRPGRGDEPHTAFPVPTL
jgi:hypothetical protein